MEPKDLPLPTRVGQYMVNMLLGGSVRLALAMPYETRLRFTGWLASRVLAPVAGYRKRIRANLAFVWPELPEDEVRLLERKVPDIAARSMIEMYSGVELRQVQGDAIEGPGQQILDKAAAERQPVVIVGAHIGSYEAFRVVTASRYRDDILAGLYRPLDNVYFNRHYAKAMRTNGAVFPRDRRGLAGMVKFLKQGNFIAFLVDQHVTEGAPLSFFGKRAYTSLAPAELALKHDALLMPIWCLREEDGIHCRVVVEAPIPHSTPEEMMQAYNVRLEKIIRAHPEQWLWIHQRWKSIH